MHDNGSTSKTRKLDYQLRQGGELLWAITDVDLEFFIVAIVMSFISDITYSELPVSKANGARTRRT